MSFKPSIYEYFKGYELIGDVIKLSFEYEGEEDYLYYKIGEKIGENDDVYTEVEEIVYIDEKDEYLVYGTYYDEDNKNALTISKEKAFIEYNDMLYRGDIKYVDGSVNDGFIYAYVDCFDFAFYVSLDIGARTYFAEAQEYNFSRTYVDYDEKNELVISYDEDEGYLATFNGDDVVFEVCDVTLNVVMYANITFVDNEHPENSYSIKVEINYWDGYFYEKENIVDIEEGEEHLVYGSYVEAEAYGTLNISKEKALVSYGGYILLGDIKYIGGRVDEGRLQAVIDCHGSTLYVELDLVYKYFTVYNSEYDFEGEYVGYYNSEDKLKIMCDGENYTATLNDKEIGFEVVEVSLTGAMTADINVDGEIRRISLVYGDSNYYLTVNYPIEFRDSIISDMKYLEENWYKKENTEGVKTFFNVSEGDENLYSLVSYLLPEKVGDKIYIGAKEYRDEDVVVLVGNNNFIKMKAWKVAGDKLYVSSYLLKEYAIANNGYIQVYNYDGEIILNANVAAFAVGQYKKVEEISAIEATISETETYGVYDYESFNGAGRVMIKVGDAATFEGLESLPEIYTVSEIIDIENNSVVETVYGFEKLEKIDDEYYLVYYTSYKNGDYESLDEKEFIVNFNFSSTTGEYGIFTFNIKLTSAQV